MEATPAQSPPTPQAQTIELDRVYQWIDDVRTQFTREIDQAILKRDLYLAVEALGGRDASDRIRRQIEARFRMNQNWEREISPRPRPKQEFPSWYRAKKRKEAAGER